MEIGSRQYVNGAIGGVVATGIAGIGLATMPDGPIVNSTMGRFIGASAIGGLAGGLAAAAAMPDESSDSAKLMSFGAGVGAGALTAGAAAGAMGLRGMPLAFAAGAGALQGVFGAMMAISATPGA